MEKWGILGLKGPKNMVLMGSKAMVGVHWRKHPRKNGGKWGEMGKPNQSTLAPRFLLFAPTSPHNTPFPPHFPLISPHFPPFFLVLGTFRVRCWVHYHPPRPGISEACLSTLYNRMQGTPPPLLCLSNPLAILVS